VSFVIAQSMENLQVVSRRLERKCEIEVIIEQETAPKICKEVQSKVKNMIVFHVFFYCVVSLSRNYRKQAALDASDIDNFSCRVFELDSSNDDLYCMYFRNSMYLLWYS
jgi:hypothetical protein